jgi:hypothetical protein
MVSPAVKVFRSKEPIFFSIESRPRMVNSLPYFAALTSPRNKRLTAGPMIKFAAI